MHIRKITDVILVAALFLTLSAEAAQPATPFACESTLTPLEQRVVDAVAYFIPKAYVHYNEVLNTYRIDTAPLEGFSFINPGTGLPEVQHICPESQFYGVPSIGLTTWLGRGRSAVLIGHNTFLSAPHSSTFNYQAYYVVFLPQEFPCRIQNLESIPADNVYDPIEFNFNNFRFFRLSSGIGVDAACVKATLLA